MKLFPRPPGPHTTLGDVCQMTPRRTVPLNTGTNNVLHDGQFLGTEEICRRAERRAENCRRGEIFFLGGGGVVREGSGKAILKIRPRNVLLCQNVTNFSFFFKLLSYSRTVVTVIHTFRRVFVGVRTKCVGFV